MLRCARSTAGSARPPPSRKPPCGPRGKGTVPAGKSVRSNVLPLGGTEGGEHSFRSFFCPRISVPLRILLPSQANSAPLLRGAVLRKSTVDSRRSTGRGERGRSLPGVEELRQIPDLHPVLEGLV